MSDSAELDAVIAAERGRLGDQLVMLLHPLRGALLDLAEFGKDRDDALDLRCVRGAKTLG